MNGLLAAQQLFPDGARPAPHEVRVGERVVAYLVLRGDLGGEVGLASDVVADLEEGGPDAFAVEDLQKLSRVGWQGPSSKVRATTRSEVRACQKTGP
jgi:hypothetical protein